MARNAAWLIVSGVWAVRAPSWVGALIEVAVVGYVHLAGKYQ
jgi:hypothetical protein